MEMEWHKEIFTDESSVQMGMKSGKNWTIRYVGEEYDTKHVQPTFHSGRKTIMVWGSFAWNKKWPLKWVALEEEEGEEGNKMEEVARQEAEQLEREKQREQEMDEKMEAINSSGRTEVTIKGKKEGKGMGVWQGLAERDRK